MHKKYMRKTYTKLIRNKDGQWIGKQYPRTNWRFVFCGIGLIVLLGFYLPQFVNAETEIVETVQTQTVSTTTQCVDVGNGHYDCAGTRERWMWNQYIEGKLEEYESKTFQAVVIDRDIKPDDKALRMNVSGYSSRPQETDSTPEVGATGENIWHLLQSGVQTCATNDFPFNTVLEVEGLGTCIVKDRMNKRYTGKFHLDWYYGYDTIGAVKHGRKILNVYVKKG